VINGLDLFSGIGGISKGLSQWVTPIAYCEIDPYARAVLLSRMSDGQLPNAPIWDDVKTLSGTHLPPVDIIYGGFPCQDISLAGLGEGLAGKRSGLFFEICRLVKELQPSFVFLENVPAIRTRGLREVIGSFTQMGYDCRWTCLTAASVGAPHKRERWFLLAHSDSSGKRGLPSGETQKNTSPGQCRGDERTNWWQVKPQVGKLADGVPFRLDSLKALGNAVVPQQVEKVFKILIGDSR
jgi:DNA (cytosine-5)-methyltransferase 1